MPCFPISTAHLSQRKRRAWFKEQADLRGKVGGSKGVATAMPVTNAPRWQWKKNAAEHRVAWQSQSDPIEAAKALFPLFVALQKEVASGRETQSLRLVALGTSLCTREALTPHPPLRGSLSSRRGLWGYQRKKRRVPLVLFFLFAFYSRLIWPSGWSGEVLGFCPRISILSASTSSMKIMASLGSNCLPLSSCKMVMASSLLKAFL